MSKAFSITEKLGGIFGSRSRKDEILELVKVQDMGAKVSTLMSYREWLVMERILTDFQNEAVDGLAVKNISKEEAQRLTNRMEQLRDIRKELIAKVKAGEVAEAKLNRIKEKQNG